MQNKQSTEEKRTGSVHMLSTLTEAREDTNRAQQRTGQVLQPNLALGAHKAFFGF